jgi:hypothetical protein
LHLPVLHSLLPGESERSMRQGTSMCLQILANETRHEHVSPNPRKYSQQVRFLVVKLIHLFRFNINIIFITNYFFSEDDALINNDALLITDFMDLKD